MKMMWMRTGLSEGVCETPRAGNGIHGGSRLGEMARHLRGDCPS